MELPYLPDNRKLLYVSIQNPWMKLARQVANTKTGCSWWPTGSVIVKKDILINIIPISPERVKVVMEKRKN